MKKAYGVFFYDFNHFWSATTRQTSQEMIDLLSLTQHVIQKKRE